MTTALVPYRGNVPPPPVRRFRMTLRQYLDQHYSLTRPIKQSTHDDYRWTVNVFEKWYGRPIELLDLTEDLLSKFLLDLEGKAAPRSLHGHRMTLLVLWAGAESDGYCDRAPERKKVRKIKVPRKNPQAWTLDEMARLIEAARRLKGVIRNLRVPRALFFETMIRVTYETGLRRHDVFNLAISTVRDDGTFSVTMAKTGFTQTCKLTPETLGMLREVSRLNQSDAEHPLLVRGNTSGTYYSCWRTIRAYAGVKGTGALQQLRRTAATHLERERPGGATGFLGHVSPDMAIKHYIDRSIAFVVQQPPALPTPVDMERLVREAEFSQAEKDSARDRYFAGKLLEAMQRYPEGASRHHLRRTASLDAGPFERAEEMLLRAGVAEPCEVSKMNGGPGTNKAPCRGLRLRQVQWAMPEAAAPIVLPDDPLATGVCVAGW